jgi:hypothetical protein
MQMEEMKPRKLYVKVEWRRLDDRDEENCYCVCVCVLINKQSSFMSIPERRIYFFL